MDVHDAVAVVTGASSDLGRQLVAELQKRGARKVYATSREPSGSATPRVQSLFLDVTDPDSIAALARIAGDATLVINNADLWTPTDLLDGDLHDVDLEMETNFYGPLGMIREFASILTANGGGAILNVLSARSWRDDPATFGAYTATKAAAWAMTDVIREELAGRGIQVTALHLAGAGGPADDGSLDLAEDPARAAASALDGLEAGLAEIVVGNARHSVDGLRPSPARGADDRGLTAAGARR